MLKKLKDLVINDQFTIMDGHTIYKVMMLFHSAKQLLAYDAANNRYCVFTIYDEDEVKLVVDEPLCITGRNLKVGDKFFWKPRTSVDYVREVVHVTENYIVYKFTQKNERTHYNVIYEGECGWTREVILCE